MAFPAGALFTIIAGLIRISIELTGMSEYKKKNEPAPILDIGIWMDLLEFISKLGIVVCMYIIMFTSKELHKGTFSEHVNIIIAFGALHLLFFMKYILAEVIDDEPAWVAEDKASMKNRVLQVRQDTNDKKLWERLSMQYTDLDLLFEVLTTMHADMARSGQLVPKIQ